MATFPPPDGRRSSSTDLYPEPPPPVLVPGTTHRTASLCFEFCVLERVDRVHRGVRTQLLRCSMDEQSSTSMPMCTCIVTLITVYTCVIDT